MAAPYKASICLATSNNFVLPGAASNDFLIYTGNCNQSMLIGVSNQSTFMRVDGSGNMAFAGNVSFSNQMQLAGIQITQRTSATTNNVTSAISDVNGFSKTTAGTVQITMDPGSNSIQFLQSNTEYMRIASNGFVAIGTSIPGYQLDVSSTNPTNSRFGSNLYMVGGSVAPSIGFNTFYNGTNWINGGTGTTIANVIQSFQGNLQFVTFPSASNGTSITPTTAFSLSNNGYVGIGTTTPSSILHISGASNGSNSIYISSPTNAIGQIAQIALGIPNGQCGVVQTVTQSGSHTDMNLLVTSNAILKSSLYIQGSTSYVGIGTSNPNCLLAVAGGHTVGTAYSNIVPPTNGLLVQGNIGIGTSNPNCLLAVAGGHTVGAAYSNIVPPTNGLLVQGNVGIGTSNPNCLLAVAGGHTVGAAYSNVVPPTDGLIIQGNTGIGISNPSYPLHIVGSGTGAGPNLAVLNTTLNNTNTNILFGKSASINAYVGFWHLGSDASTSNFLRLGVFGGPTELQINKSGNSIFGNSGTPIVPGSMLVVSSNMSVGSAYVTTAAPTNGMIIQGNVGIGTSNPQYPLDVVGNVNLGSISTNTVGNICAGNLGMFRNRIINGDMRIAQRGTSIVSGSGNTNVYMIDRWYIGYIITTGGLTQSQNTLTTSDTPYLNAGFKYSYKITVNTAVTSYNFIVPTQNIEGLNMSDFNWGSTAGTPIVLSFWLRTNAATNSIIPVTLRNFAATHSYNANVTVTATNTWQFVTLQIAAPPSGSSWNIDNTVGVNLFIGGFNQTTSSSPGTWQNGNFIGTSTATNIWATLNNFIEFTGVQLEKGTIATPFEFRPFATELQLCQRYYEKSFDITTAPAANIGANNVMFSTSITSSSTMTAGSIFLKTVKRAIGTAVLYNPYAAVASNSTLRIPNGSIDVSISYTVQSTNSIIVSMSSNAAFAYHSHFTYDCEL